MRLPRVLFQAEPSYLGAIRLVKGIIKAGTCHQPIMSYAIALIQRQLDGHCLMVQCWHHNRSISEGVAPVLSAETMPKIKHLADISQWLTWTSDNYNVLSISN